MSIHIRLYNESDADGVTALWERTFVNLPGYQDSPATIRQKLEHLDLQRAMLFVGELDDRIVGTVIAGFDGHRGWLYSVAVDPGLRRSGLGTHLLRHAEQALTDLGCTKINLQVLPENGAVVEFYRRQGYTVEARISMGKRLPHQEAA